jgi:hypothetical protein
MAVERAKIDRTAGPAAGAEDVEPGRFGEQGSPDGGRPQHVAAGGQASVPAIDHGLGFLARLEVGGAGLDVESSCPDTHRASIEAPVREVDPGLRLSCGPTDLDRAIPTAPRVASHPGSHAGR